MFNNIFWDNRAGTRAAGTVTGIGVAGDASPINHWDMGRADGRAMLSPTNSMLAGPRRARRQPKQPTGWTRPVRRRPTTPRCVPAVARERRIRRGDHGGPGLAADADRATTTSRQAPRRATRAPQAVCAPTGDRTARRRRPLDFDDAARPTGAALRHGRRRAARHDPSSRSRGPVSSTPSRGRAATELELGRRRPPGRHRINGNQMPGPRWRDRLVERQDPAQARTRRPSSHSTKLGPTATQQGLLLKTRCDPGQQGVLHQGRLRPRDGNVQVWTKAPSTARTCRRRIAAPFASATSSVSGRNPTAPSRSSRNGGIVHDERDRRDPPVAAIARRRRRPDRRHLRRNRTRLTTRRSTTSAGGRMP